MGLIPIQVKPDYNIIFFYKGLLHVCVKYNSDVKVLHTGTYGLYVLVLVYSRPVFENFVMLAKTSCL